jgi:hypothetical protein
MSCGIGGFGSLDNFMLANTRLAQTPIVGMGVTFLSWTDRHAGTIVEVSPSGKTITVQEDISTRTDTNGMSESQTYAYAPNPKAEKLVYRLTRRNRWMRKGSVIRIGERDAYHDFSF